MWRFCYTTDISEEHGYLFLSPLKLTMNLAANELFWQVGMKNSVPGKQNDKRNPVASKD